MKRSFDDARWYAKLVNERWRYLAHELLPRRSLGAYTVGPAKLTILVRHHAENGKTPENWPLHEVFREGDYEPPGQVAERLAATPSPRVVDIGGNVGFFGVMIFSRWPQARVIAFEPDPANLEILRECVKRNGLGDRWEIIAAAAAPAAGELQFAGGHGSQSRVADALAPASGTVTAVDVFPFLQDADLVKMDIEGSEWALLADSRLATAGIGSMVLEYHSIGCPEDNPKRAAARLLGEAGFTVEPAPSDDNPIDEPFWGRGVLWAWR